MSEVKKGEMVYVPFGEKNEITLTPQIVSRYIVCKTRSGATASYDEVIKFMMLCRARELNPFVGDAFLVGYDTQRDGPQYSLITAHQALLKRAEVCPAFDGIQSGIVIKQKSTGDGIDSEGTLVLKDETVIGGWARVFRRDRKIPFYARVDLKVYDTKRSRWAKDPAGMIAKVAEGAALRKAFPTQCGGLYTEEEMEAVTDNKPEPKAAASAKPASLDDFVEFDELVVEGEIVQPDPSEVGSSFDADGLPKSDPKPDPVADTALSPEYNSMAAQISFCDSLTELDALSDLVKIAKVSDAERQLLADCVTKRDADLLVVEGGAS